MAKSPEEQHRYQVAKEFKGVNTKANRTAIKDEEFSWLENMMPIGFGNLKSVPAAVQVADGTGANVTWANTVTSLQSVNVNNTDYVLAFQANGGAEAFALQTSTKSTVAAPGKFSTANVATTQWKDERAVIIDPTNGLFSWDGNNVVFIGSLGPIAVTSIGGGFFDSPAVIIAPPDDPNGKQATASASISPNSGTLQTLNVTNRGLGYSWVPNVTISAPTLPSGTQAVGSATLLGNSIVALNLSNPGSGYDPTKVTVTIDGGGPGVVNVATGAAVVNLGTLQSISLQDPGTGYRKPPAITIQGGGGVNASAQASLINFATGTVAIVPQSGGQGYNNPANLVVTISGGVFTNVATATGVIVGDQIGSYVMSNPGQYTVPPSVSISGGGGSNATAIAVVTNQSPTDVATFSGRVWIIQGRVVFFSAADSYNDFASVSAGNFVLPDTTLHNNLKGILSANNFLYLFGEDSINVFSDVRVQTDGSTIFTNTNVSASIGSRYPSSIFAYYRTVMFMNDFGVFALVGATTTKLSESLDGIIPFIDFTKPITAGQVVINNVLCACFSFTYNDPLGSPRPLQAVFFEKKWFFTSQALGQQQITNIPFQGQQQLYSTDGHSLFQYYANNTMAINTLTQSALWGLGDPIRDKQAIELGVEATFLTATGIFVNIDTEKALGKPVQTPPQQSFTNAIQWVNNLGNPVSWINNTGQTVQWISNALILGQYNLLKSEANAVGKYLGFTVTSNTGGMVLHTLELEHILRARF